MEDNQVDREIEDVIAAETRRGRGRGPLSREQRRKEKALERATLKAIAFNDERRFAECLRLAGIKDGSPEYVNAWKIFRQASGRSSLRSDG